MAQNKIFISSGIVANDTGEAETSNQVFISSGIIPTDKAVGAVAPTGVFYGPLVGPLGGPL